MALHRVLLRPLSPWGTPVRSDTLAGLLLYRMAEDEGETALQTALEAFQNGAPPFALSSAMPEGAVFMPKLPPMRRERFAAKIQAGRFRNKDGASIELFDALILYKEFRKKRFLPLEIWETHRASLSTAALFTEYCRNSALWEMIPNLIQVQEMHVSIDRSSGAALEGGLFASQAFWAKSDAAFHLYAETDDCPLLLARLKRIGQLGYGRDSSTGKGLFSIEKDAAFRPPASDLPHSLLISMLSAENLSGLNGWYATEVKTGKAGPAFCGGNPFKSPFLCVQEGAVLTALPKGPFVLRAIHANPAIAQITQPLVLPCKLAEGEDSHA